MIFQCFFPGIDRFLGDFRKMVVDLAEKRRAGLLPLATRAVEEERDDVDSDAVDDAGDDAQ
jgi:hypothetical protein